MGSTFRLKVDHYVVKVGMVHAICEHDVLQKITCYASQRLWSIIFCLQRVILLEEMHHIGVKLVVVIACQDITYFTRKFV